MSARQRRKWKENCINEIAQYKMHSFIIEPNSYQPITWNFMVLEIKFSTHHDKQPQHTRKLVFTNSFRVRVYVRVCVKNVRTDNALTKMRECDRLLNRMTTHKIQYNSHLRAAHMFCGSNSSITTSSVLMVIKWSWSKRLNREEWKTKEKRRGRNGW